ncbi:Uncharacterised protein [uncultured archaeon]|nr:Uncharacterised protein [uncultured archaeon]
MSFPRSSSGGRTSSSSWNVPGAGKALPGARRHEGKVRMDSLETENRYMENLLSDFEDGFWSFFYAQKERLKEDLDLLAKLPATHETKSLHFRVKKESQAIMAARVQHKITSVNALKQLSELEGRSSVSSYPGQP